jgi:tubulin delta
MKNYSIIDPKSKEMITLQIGQCGNQLGHALFDKIAQESNDKILEHESAFFRRHGSVASTSSIIEEAKLTARSILIDMEPKVIQKCQREAVSSTSKWQYDNENTVIKQSGSGNNWAYGYAVHGTATETELLDTIQKVCIILHYHAS